MTSAFRCFRQGELDFDVIVEFLTMLSQEWPNMGLEGLDLDAYAKKLSLRAECIAAVDFSAAVFFYCNDVQTHVGYITLIGKRGGVVGGVGRLLHDAMLNRLREVGMKCVRLEVRRDNERAIRFYKSVGYAVATTAEHSYYMERGL